MRALRSQRLWLALAASLVVLAAVAGAATARVWAPLASAPRLDDITFNGVSCASRTDCVAVGSQFIGGRTVADRALIESRAGWRVVGPARMRGRKLDLESVSCPRDSWCMAVGASFAPGSITGANLDEIWNGRTWRVGPVDRVAGRSRGTVSVSCTSPSFCVAVGDRQVSMWNGTRWLDAPGVPTGAAAPNLRAVSCSSATACTAVGHVGPHRDQALRFNGTRWAPQALPYIPSSGPGPHSYDPDAGPTGVSCPSVHYCMLVGYSLASSRERDVEELWTGNAWQVMPAALPPRSVRNAGFEAVSCTKPGSCTAVGDGEPAHWDGRRWMPQPKTGVARHSGSLSAISCVDRRCVAGGNDFPTPGGDPRSLLATAVSR
jgi:hypothetical protein